MGVPAEVLRALEELPPQDSREVAEGALMQRSLQHYIRGMWPILPEHAGGACRWNWHIGAIAEHLEAVSSEQIEKLIITMPPGLGKSILVSVAWPTWEWTHSPHLGYISVSANDAVIDRDANRVRDLVQSDWYRRRFLPDWQIAKDRAAKWRFYNTRGGFRISRTTGQRITGIRAHRRILDDLIDADDAFHDKSIVGQVNDWLDQALSSRDILGMFSPIVLVMQRLLEHDPAGHLLEQGGWEHLCLPNEWDGSPHHTVIGYSDPRSEPGDLLFPELLDRAKSDHKRMKVLGEAGYAGQYQQAPVPAAGTTFSEEDFRLWTRETLPEFDMLILSCDLNNLKRKRATRDTDYAVKHIWGMSGPDRYLLGRYREKCNLARSVLVIAHMISEWHPGKVLIELKANGPSAVAQLQAKWGNLIEGVNVQGESKEQRAEACTPVVEGGHVYIPDPSMPGFKWVKAEFLPEVCGFPHRRRDDHVDAMTMALIWCVTNQARPMGAGLIGRLRPAEKQHANG